MAVDERTDRVFLLTEASGFQPFPTVASLLDARSGRVLRMVPVGLSATALAVDARTGTAFVANSHDRAVLSLDGRTASIVRSVPVEVTPGALAVDARTGTIFVANAYDDSVSMVEATSGRVLRTVPLGLSPYALTVDQRTGRVVVLTRVSLWASATADQVA